MPQPRWGCVDFEPNPRVAAQRGNPGLVCITASRLLAPESFTLT
jgi:hypothetical protein